MMCGLLIKIYNYMMYQAKVSFDTDLPFENLFH